MFLLVFGTFCLYNEIIYSRRNNRQIQYIPSNATVIKREVSPEDLVKAERSYRELKNFIKSTDAHQRAPAMLEHHLGLDKDRRNKYVKKQSLVLSLTYMFSSALHIFISLNKKEEVTFLLKMLVLSKKFELTNVPNAESLTPLHIAIMCRNEEFVAYLLQCEANPLTQDVHGRTALHIAIKSVASPRMLEMLLSSSNYARDLVDLEDYGKHLIYLKR